MFPDEDYCFGTSFCEYDGDECNRDISSFKLTEHYNPPQDTLLETMNSGGDIQLLKKKGNLWWFPDYSMYVYYTPKYWRYPSFFGMRPSESCYR